MFIQLSKCDRPVEEILIRQEDIILIEAYQGYHTKITILPKRSAEPIEICVWESVNQVLELLEEDE